MNELVIAGFTVAPVISAYHGTHLVIIRSIQGKWAYGAW